MAETSFIIDNGRWLNLKDTTARKSIGSCSALECGNGQLNEKEETKSWHF